MKKCTVDGCGGRHYAKGFCQKHYARFKKHGDPLVTLIAPKGTPLADRLKRHSKKVGACIVWTGADARGGYGQIQINGKPTTAHRAAYKEHVGPIPEGMCVLHRCDVRKCINPEHLFLGTNDDNMEDMVGKGRQAKGSRHGMSKLTENDIPRIRKQLDSGTPPHIIAKEYGVSSRMISYISEGKNWKHVN